MHVLQSHKGQNPHWVSEADLMTQALYNQNTECSNPTVNTLT